MSPLARFLSSPNEGELDLANAKHTTKRMSKDESIRSNEIGYYEHSTLGGVGVLPRSVLLQDSRIYDGLLFEEEASYYRFNNGGFGREKEKEDVKVKGARGPSSSSSTTNNANVVKGQWTAEEDR